jgi:hypothetical protein
MKREFVVERQGKAFVLYAGLLDEAHAQGLKSIRTTLVQIPDESNGYVAICQAEVTTEKGTFTGLGDASPANVARAMQTCLIRMAETRAKARAMRDAVNVSAVALEELGSDVDDDALDEPDVPSAPAMSPAARLASSPSGFNGDLATQAQVRLIYVIGRDQLSMAENQVDERSVAQYGVPPAELSKRMASEFITTLKATAKK